MIPADRLLFEIAPGADPDDPATWVFEDVTGMVRHAEGLLLSQGRSDEGARVDASALVLTVDNDDGRWVRTNPLGVWFGRIGLNTPLRVSMRDDSMVVHERGTVFISELPPRWSRTGADAVAQVRADGRIRRDSQGAQALNSALTRSLTRRPAVVAYWPCEDGRDARSVSSPIRGVSSFELGAEVEPGAGEDIPAGSLPGLLKAEPGATNVMGRVPTHPSTSEYNAMLLFRQDETTEVFRTALTLHTSSAAVPRWRIRTSATQTLIEARDPDGVVVLSQTQTIDPRVHGRWVLVMLGLQQNGTALDWSYAILTANTDATFLNGNTGTLSSTSMGRVTSLGAGTGHFASTPPERFFGHITLLRNPVDQLDLDAIHGYTGERAAHRLERLCSEERLHSQVVGDPNLTMPMGPQRPDTLLTQFHEVGATDGGIFHEIDGGYGYRTHTDLYNQAEVLALTVEDEFPQPPEPTDDDQQIRNDVTAQAPGGSSARMVDEDSIRRLGRYAESVSVNPSPDSQLSQIASWRRHLGTVDEMRWPRIQLSLDEHPELVDQWLAVRIGDRLTVDHAITQIAGVDVDLVVDGWSERIDQFVWDAELNCVPAAPYRVWQLEHGTSSGEPEQFGRLWSPRPYLAEDIDVEATEFDVIVPVQRPLNPAPDFEDPITTDVAGAVAATFVPVDWRTDAVTAERDAAAAFRGRHSLRITPTGGTPQLGAGVWSTSGRGVTTADRVSRASMWLHSPVGGFTVRIALQTLTRFNTQSAFIQSPDIAVPAGGWLRASVSGSSMSAGGVGLASISGVGIWLFYVTGGSDPANVLYIDDAEVGVPGAPFTTDPASFPQDIVIGGEVMTVTAVGADDGTGAQTFTVTRSVNGIAKPHLAGSPVAMSPSHVISL